MFQTYLNFIFIVLSFSLLIQVFIPYYILNNLLKKLKKIFVNPLNKKKSNQIMGEKMLFLI